MQVKREGDFKVLVAYHFYPHYRRGVVREIERALPGAVFLADFCESFRGVPAMSPDEFRKRVHAPVIVFRGIVVQWRLIIEAIRPEYQAYVLFADPHFLSTWIAAVLVRLSGRKVVFWGHGILSVPRNPLARFFKKAFFSLCNQFFSYGESARQNWVDVGLSSEKFVVGYNSLDYVRQLPLRKKLLQSERQVNGEYYNLLCISRLTTASNYQLVLDAVIRLKGRTRKPIRVRFVGDGECRLALQHHARMHELNVDFLGEIYDDELTSEIIWDADVVVSPGKVGLTALHSLTFGTPVISHSSRELQMPEFESIEHRVTGSLFEHGNVDELAKEIEWWLVASDENRGGIRSECFRVIDDVWNPMNQARILSEILEG